MFEILINPVSGVILATICFVFLIVQPAMADIYAMYNISSTAAWMIGITVTVMFVLFSTELLIHLEFIKPT